MNGKSLWSFEFVVNDLTPLYLGIVKVSSH